MNFCKLVDKYTVTIPMIQRDYAQGRKSEERIREDILSCIVEKIDTGLHLDFIYGSVDENLLIFTPLDGQQRLTTLFLLHWYVAAKNNHLNEKDKLKKFRYETRISSTDFIAVLVDSIGSITIKNTSKKKLSEKIKDCTWFFSSWTYDPTISAMLIMLDAIHEKFSGKANSLVNFDKITFDFINLDDFKLTDDLYIKMNARGIPLTPFENFKSKFEKILLSDELKNEKFEGEELKDYFSDKIETSWVESFWEYADKKEICDFEYLTIDKPFMRFFWYITEMLYFKNDIGKKDTFFYDKDGNPLIDYNLIDLVYQDCFAVRFLFQSLNSIKILNAKIEETCFYHQDDSGKNRVALFKNKEKEEEYNFLTRSVKNGKLTDYEKLTLFSVVFYVNELSFDSEEFTDNLRDLIRVVRNLLHQVREWKDDKSHFELVLNVSKYHLILKAICNDFVSYKNIYEILSSNQELSAAKEAFKGEYLEHERNKAALFVSDLLTKKIVCELEDHNLVKGSTHNFHIEDKNSLKNRKETFFKIWNVNSDDRNIMEGFLSVIDYSIKIWGGHKKFFGFKELDYKLGVENNAGWRSIITFTKKSNDLINFLDEYAQYDNDEDNNSVLNKIKSQYLRNVVARDWRYYFVKYKSMTDEYHWVYTPWVLGDGDKTGFSIRHLKGNDFRGAHINPYVRTVIGFINKADICDIEKSRSTRSTSSDFSPLVLKDDIKLFCEGNGWRVEIANIPAHNNTCFIDCWLIVNLPNIQIEAGKTWLKPTETMDMIEVAVAFICELYQLENPLDKNKLVDSDTGGVA